MKLYDSGVYLVNGTELIADGADAAAAVKSRKGTRLSPSISATAARILSIQESQ